VTSIASSCRRPAATSTWPSA